MSKTTNLSGYQYHPFLITKSRIKERIHETGLECGSDTFEALNLKVERILNESIIRARKNSRKRVLGRDM